MAWIYDYPANRMLEMWSTDHSFGYPYPNSTAMYNGTAGDYRIYLHSFKKCIKFEFGMGIPRPDCFSTSISGGNYTGRECRLGYWADHYVVDMGPQYGPFEAWFHVDTAYPLEFKGMTIPTVLADMIHSNMVPIFEYDSVDTFNISS